MERIHYFQERIGWQLEWWVLRVWQPGGKVSLLREEAERNAGRQLWSWNWVVKTGIGRGGLIFKKDQGRIFIELGQWITHWVWVLEAGKGRNLQLKNVQISALFSELGRRGRSRFRDSEIEFHIECDFELHEA